MAVAGRTHRPVIDHGRCAPCSICLGACPAEMIPEMTREEGSLRGSIYRGMDRKGVFGSPDAAVESPPCQLACPLHQDVRGYMEHIAAGRHEEALQLIRETNPLPSVCGHVCHRPCEEACMRGLFDEALSIRKLKRFVTGYTAGMTDSPRRVEPGRGKVGIIGAGPAGLTAAHDLAAHGCAVEMIESFDEPGGMLAWAIPEFRLPRKVLRQDIAYIRNMGVRIRTGLYFGHDVTLSDLKEEGVEAFIVATGTQRGLGIHGEEADGYEGYVDCLTFLRSFARHKHLDTGTRVLVLGGGNAAVDSARAAVRLGAKEVKIVYRRGPEQMPAHRDEIEAAMRDGVAVEFFSAPVRIVSSGREVRGLECVKTEVRETAGSKRPEPVPVPGSVYVVEADMIICAIGQAPDPVPVTRGIWGEAVRNRSLSVDPETGLTHMTGIFVAGDFLNGPTTVVEAMASGRRAARAAWRYLSGGGAESHE